MKPFSLPKALQSFTDEQLNELNAWLDDAVTYKEIRQRIFDTHGIKLCNALLSRYVQRRVLADHTLDHSDSAKNIRTFLALQNAEPVPYDEAGLAMVQKRAFQAACAPTISVTHLACLQRVFHYKTARAEVARRAAQADRRNDLAEATLQLKRQEFAARQAARAAQASSVPSGPNPRKSDRLGPLATNWQEVGQRICKQFDISPEEDARRAELHKTWKQPHVRPGHPLEINPVP